mgnify:FL=1
MRNFVHHRKILEYLCIEEVWNSGVSFGLFHSLPNSDLIFSVLSSLISIVLFFYLIKSYNKILKASLSLIIAGAIGNVIDRLRFGAVYDFIDIHWHQWHWPAFNFADVFITLGALFLIYPRRVEDGISKRNRSCN